MPRKVAELNELYPTDCPILMAVRAEYAEWTTGLSRGRIYYAKGKEQKQEHRLVAEIVHGPLTAGRKRHVHHINGNRTENSAVNLAILTAKEHAHVHNGHIKMTIQICPSCGNSFVSKDYEHQKFCSYTCTGISYMKIVPPEKTELDALLMQIKSVNRIAQVYGVARTVVYRWMKSYGLKRRDYPHTKYRSEQT